MYTDQNFKTKKELKAAVDSGKAVSVYQPNDMFGNAPTNGRITLEGPHYPQPHKWYAQAVIANGVIVKGSVK